MYIFPNKESLLLTIVISCRVRLFSQRETELCIHNIAEYNAVRNLIKYLYQPPLLLLLNLNTPANLFYTFQRFLYIFLAPKNKLCLNLFLNKTSKLPKKNIFINYSKEFKSRYKYFIIQI